MACDGPVAAVAWGATWLRFGVFPISRLSHRVSHRKKASVNPALWPKNVPLQGKIFFLHAVIFGSTVFECEQTVRNLSYHRSTRKYAEFCSKSEKVQKITFFSHVQQDFCQHPRDVADMWLDYCS